MSLKVIGAGFGRTGTMSLKKALEQLYGEKCFHMVELLRSPERLAHLKKAGKNDTASWHKLFEGYGAVTDFPCCLYYKELADLYPEAKLILTERDPEAWYASTLETIYRGKPKAPRDFAKLMWNYLRSADVRQVSPIFMYSDKLIWEGFFNGKFEDKSYSIELYLQHNEEVKNSIPEDRLLVFNVKQGWKPLCDFLGEPVPETTFPRTHERTEFNKVMDLLLDDGVLKFQV